jgi:hypothetical protein
MSEIPISDIQETTDDRVQPVAIQGPDGQLLRTGDTPSDATYVKIVDEAGKTQPSGSDSDSAIYMRLLGMMALMSGPGIYASPIQFTVAQFAATQIDLSGGFPTITDVSQFLLVVQISNAGVVTVHYPHTNAYAWDSVNSRLTVTGATFAGTDVFGVVIRGSDRYASAPENAINNIQQNPSHLYGQAVEVLVQENIPISTVTVYKNVSKFRQDKVIQVLITGAGLTVKLWLTNEPGTDPTAKTYYQDAALTNLTTSGQWAITYPVEDLKFEFVSTVATDDVECYMSLR